MSTSRYFRELITESERSESLREGGPSECLSLPIILHKADIPFSPPKAASFLGLLGDPAAVVFVPLFTIGCWDLSATS